VGARRWLLEQAVLTLQASEVCGPCAHRVNHRARRQIGKGQVQRCCHVGEVPEHVAGLFLGGLRVGEIGVLVALLLLQLTEQAADLAEQTQEHEVELLIAGQAAAVGF